MHQTTNIRHSSISSFPCFVSAMAFNCSSSAAKHLALAVFIFGLLSQYQLEARSTQFFKATPTSNFNDSNTDSNANIAAKEQDSSEKTYGLVPDDVSDATKTSNENYNYMAEQSSELDGTTDQGYPTTYNDKAYVTKPQGYQPNNNNNYGSYEKDQKEDQELGATSLLDQDAGHSTTYNNNDAGFNTYNSQQQEFSQEEKDAVLSYNTNNNNNNYNGDQESYNTNTNIDNNNYNYNNNNNNNYRYNGQQEGMSDTRFLENGRYHYKFKAENRYSGNTNNYNNNNNNNFNVNSYAHYNNNNNNANSYDNYNNNNYQDASENEEFDAFNP